VVGSHPHQKSLRHIYTNCPIAAYQFLELNHLTGI
jgi:hypothetical protein